MLSLPAGFDIKEILGWCQWFTVWHVMAFQAKINCYSKALIFMILISNASFELTWTKGKSEIFWSLVVRHLSINYSHILLFLLNHWINVKILNCSNHYPWTNSKGLKFKIEMYWNKVKKIFSKNTMLQFMILVLLCKHPHIV